MDRWEDVCSSLSKSKLEEINLSENGIPKDLGGLTEWLKVNDTLKVLNLSDNQLNVQSCKELAKILELNSTLEFIDLSKNELLGRGIIELARELENNTTLETIKIGK
mmetsp:Transcript_33479/g.38036  ORF Transcript_33479/g.38036 Transcript_33479/m.38036 type:complete len:107 (+) Transcript_33479:1245-1565(+)